MESVAQKIAELPLTPLRPSPFDAPDKKSS